MSTVLCVIDVQPRFKSAAEHVIPEVVHQIKLAIKRKSPIVLVEYGIEFPSYDEVYEAFYCANPTLRTIVKKTQDDGSDDIIDGMKVKDFKFNRIRLCGVNTCSCVEKTARGLKRTLWPDGTKLFKRLEVSESATYCAHHLNNICYQELKHALRRIR